MSHLAAIPCYCCQAFWQPKCQSAKCWNWTKKPPRLAVFLLKKKLIFNDGIILILSTNVPFMEKPGSSFLLANCVKNMCRRAKFEVKMQDIKLHFHLKCHFHRCFLLTLLVKTLSIYLFMFKALDLVDIVTRNFKFPFIWNANTCFT